MWLLFAVGSACFAGVTAILAKCGIRRTDSTVATAIRTVVVLLFAWLMVLVVGAQDGLAALGGRTLLLLLLSGLATGASWLCYFRALQLGPVNPVVAVDKFSTVLTILLAFVLLGEPIGWSQGLGVALIAAGTWCMIDRTPRPAHPAGGKGWLFYAAGSALFASLTAILGKLGMQGVDSNLGHRRAHRGGAGDGLGHGTGDGQGRAGAARSPGGAGLYLFLRRRHRRLLAVLFPGAAVGAGQRGGPHRQAEHSGHGGLFPPGVRGETDRPLRLGAGPVDRGHADHAAVKSGRNPLGFRPFLLTRQGGWPRGSRPPRQQPADGQGDQALAHDGAQGDQRRDRQRARQ